MQYPAPGAVVTEPSQTRVFKRIGPTAKTVACTNLPFNRANDDLLSLGQRELLGMVALTMVSGRISQARGFGENADLLASERANVQEVSCRNFHSQSAGRRSNSTMTDSCGQNALDEYGEYAAND